VTRAAPRLSLVVAVARNGVIGRDGGLPWRHSGDLKHFRQVTMGKPVVMGRKTWDSLPVKLDGRDCIVVTRDAAWRAEGAWVFSDIKLAAAAALNRARVNGVDEACIIGGAQIYAAMMPLADRLIISDIDLDAEGDTVFPFVDPHVWMPRGRQEIASGAKDTVKAVVRILDRGT
jgi:dihydrofolate reductase